MAQLGDTIKKYNIKSHNLYNMDETGLALSNQHVKVLTKKEAPRSKKISDKINKHYTLVFWVSANRFYVHFLLILLLKTLSHLDTVTQAFYYSSQ